MKGVSLLSSISCFETRYSQTFVQREIVFEASVPYAPALWQVNFWH